MTPKLPEGFVATLNERIYLETLDAAPPARTAATLTAEAPLQIRLPQEEIREPYLEILQTRGASERLVTVLELLSPKNKASGAGQREYKTKQSRLLASDVHLLEIDLLRGGQDVLAVPRLLLRHRAPCDYAICLHQSGAGPAFGCWAFTLRDPLPHAVSVPLTLEQGIVALDMAAAFARAFEDDGYERRIEYAAPPPPPPLSPNDEGWLDERLHAQGLRR